MSGLYLNRQIEYTGGLVLPVGFKVPEPFDILRDGERYSAWHIEGIKSAVARNNVNERGERSSGKLTYAVEIENELRVMNRLWTTETPPAHEVLSYHKMGATDAVLDTVSGSRELDSRECDPPVVAGESTVDQSAVESSGSTSEVVDVDDDAAVQRPELPAPAVSRPNPAPMMSCGCVMVVDFMSLLVRAYKAGPPSKIHGVRSMFETLCNAIDRLCPEFIVFALDGGHDHRSKLYPAYKANRPPKEPELLEQIKLGEQALQAIGWPSIRVQGWEADDILASFATQFNDVTAATVLLTSDKDALQICATTRARVYHPWGDGVHFNEARCGEKYGVPFAMMGDFLALQGDTSDSVPGVAGVGQKTAAELMLAHKSLDAVLAAAAAGQIKGKVGKSLQEQAEVARLSRDLVTLRTDLPIGRHWEWWPLDEPRAGWRQRLQELGLGSTAQRLAQRLPDEGPSSVSHFRAESSHVDIPCPAVSIESSHPVHIPAAAVESVPVISAERPVEHAGTIDSFAPVNLIPVYPPAADDVATWPTSLASLPATASLLDKVRAVYRTGLDHHSKGREVTNDWKRDCVYHPAYEDGLNGRPLSVQLTDYDSDGMRLKRVPAPAKPDPVSSAGPKTATLF